MTTITCPNGFGETDRHRCFDRAACPGSPRVCLLCPIPFVLVAEGGTDSVNRRLFARLKGLLSKGRKRQRKPVPLSPLTQEVLRYMDKAVAVQAVPCTLHKFYQTLRKLGAPKIQEKGRHMVLQAAGLQLQRVDGVIRVVGRVAA